MADVTVPQRALPGSLILCLLLATSAILTSCRPQYSSDRRLAGRIAALYSAADEAEPRAIVEPFNNRRMAAILREKAEAMAK